MGLAAPGGWMGFFMLVFLGITGEHFTHALQREGFPVVSKGALRPEILRATTSSGAPLSERAAAILFKPWDQSTTMVSVMVWPSRCTSNT